MSNRHIGRTLALQVLFELDMSEQINLPKEEMKAIVVRDRDEFSLGYNDIEFVTNLITEVQSRVITLDDIIVRAAPDWPIEKINGVDRNILRIGLYELLFSNRGEVPPKVAIDEAIELAKDFGGETSGKFVNGVLGAIYKEMGEPEKDQSTKKTPSAHPKENLVGAVVYSNDNGVVHIGLVHDVFGYWTLTKGRLGEGADIEELAVRKIKSEIGVDVKIVAPLGENEYIANKPEIGKVIKHVHYFLAEAPFVPFSLEKKGGLDDAKWFTLDQIKTLHMYDDILPLIEKGIAIIEEKH